MEPPELLKVLLSEEQITSRVAELGSRISADCRGRQILLVAVLKGAVMFVADLARRIDVPVSFDFMAVSSYGAATRSSGVVRIIKDLEESIDGRDVLIVEDIVDTGLTLRYLYDLLLDRKPASLKVCALLDKWERREVEVPIDYLGFRIPNEFVVGYGLDFNGKYRQYPFIFVLKPEAYSTGGGERS